MATPAIPEQPVVDQPVVVQTKHCRHCHRDLPIADFYQRGDGAPSSWCRSCQRESSARSYHDPGKGLARAARLKAERAAMREATKDQKLMPFHLIARSIGVSPQQAWNIFNSGMRKLRAGATVEARGLYAESVKMRDQRRSPEEQWADVLGEEDS